MTLRRRLVLSIVALVVAVSAVIGAASIIALASIQTGAIDQQITGATHRAQRYLQQNQSGQPSIDLSRPSGQAAGTLTAYFVDGQVVIANVLDDYGRPSGIAQSSAEALGTVHVDADPETVDLGGGTGRYRLAAVNVGPAVLVVGLPMAPVYDSVWKLFWVVISVVAAALVAGSVVAAFVVRRSLRPLERVAETASTVARMPLDRSDALDGVRVPDTDPRTEVGRVGSAFNRMLGHIAGAMQARERSEQKVRQFVADASHELRTPLASVRGYAELTRRMGGDLPKDVVYAMSRIESESIRMTSMVEDLLLLARLDEGREIQLDEVDLTGLVLDAVNDAHAASPEHVIEVDVPSSPVVVVRGRRAPAPGHREPRHQRPDPHPRGHPHHRGPRAGTIGPRCRPDRAGHRAGHRPGVPAEAVRAVRPRRQLPVAHRGVDGARPRDRGRGRAGARRQRRGGERAR